MTYVLAAISPLFVLFTNGDLSSTLMSLFLAAFFVVLALTFQVVLLGPGAFDRYFAQQERQYRELLEATREHGFMGYPR